MFANYLIFFCINTCLYICKVPIVEHVMGTFKCPKNQTIPFTVIAGFLKCIFKMVRRFEMSFWHSGYVANILSVGDVF